MTDELDDSVVRSAGDQGGKIVAGLPRKTSNHKQQKGTTSTKERISLPLKVNSKFTFSNAINTFDNA